MLAPTRELAEQISRELTPLAKASKRWLTAVYGGVGYEAQRAALKRGADVLVATPGRLADLIAEGAVSLVDVDLVVVDEADRMADMGFLPQVRHLLDMTNPARQTAPFSATLDQEVARLTQRYQTDPVTHHVGGDEITARPPTTSGRLTPTIGSRSRPTSSPRPRPLWFSPAPGMGPTRWPASSSGGGSGPPPSTAVGFRAQRTRALKAFGQKHVEALIATDVAARGIHVNGVTSVVPFDLPADHKDYLHRSGLTARAGAGRVVVSLVMAEQIGELRKLQRQVGFHDALHDPDNGWLSIEGGSRIGERPLAPPSPARSTAKQSRQSRQSRGGRGNRRAASRWPRSGVRRRLRLRSTIHH